MVLHIDRMKSSNEIVASFRDLDVDRKCPRSGQPGHAMLHSFEKLSDGSWRVRNVGDGCTCPLPGGADVHAELDAALAESQKANRS